MLRFLRIEHLAVIDAVQVEFEPGLNVLTGETGAGKSMLVEAVGLLMGGRASADLIRTGETHAQVQAEFDVADAADRSARPSSSAGISTRRAAVGRSSTTPSSRPRRSASRRRRSWSCTASTSTRRCSIRKAIS